MVVQENFHSRLVAWMKIILPMAALGLLSTLFLFSRSVDLNDPIPFTKIDLEQRAHDQGATNPTFAGVSTGGEQVSFEADIVRPVASNPDRLIAERVRAELKLTNGTVIDIVSNRGESNQADFSAMLDGDVRVTTTTGYDIRSDKLMAEFDTLYVETPGPVEGTGPPGDLTAGRMILSTDPKTDTAHLVFTDGVKLVYIPPQTKD